MAIILFEVQHACMSVFCQIWRINKQHFYEEVSLFFSFIYACFYKSKNSLYVFSFVKL